MGEFGDVLIGIPGFPMYHLDEAAMKVISYHKVETGKYLSRGTNDKGQEGYTLYNRGKHKFFTMEKLRGTVELHNLKLSLKEKQEMAMTQTRTPKKGDFLVGSLLKSNGSMSFSAFPGCHATQAKAADEAARLAGTYKDKKFIVVEVKGVVAQQDIVWE